MRPEMVRRSLLQGLALWLLLVGLLCANPARAQGVELALLDLQRQDGELTLDFDARLLLPRSVEDAMQRGVPVYFVAEATLYRSRWYWRDERLARVQRSWRVAYQPLTSTWRVGFGGFNQGFASLDEALTLVSRSTRWKVAELSQLDPESKHYLVFSYRLDNSQLPSPLQLGLGSQAEWVLGVERTLRLD
jgi:hypothetical protein